MSTAASSSARMRWATYIVLGAFFVILAVIALFVFQSAKTGADSQRKADEFTAALTGAGLPAPSQDQIVRVLGDDGGALCADPNSALQQAAINSGLSNGAGGPGARPVIAASNVLEGMQLAIGVYCPEELDEFSEFVDSLNLDDPAPA